MKIDGLRWKKLGITVKFNLVFSLLLALFLLIAATAYISLFNIQRAEKKIQNSKVISSHVLKMDHGMERAHRLHRDFFFHYKQLGLQKAHEEYAQPSVRAISQVIRLSNELKNKIIKEGLIEISDEYKSDLNLYLASARRFADTSIQAVELLSERAAPTNGVETKLMNICQAIDEPLRKYPDQHIRIASACSHAKDYIIHRQRSFMQAALNELTDLQTELKNWKPLSVELATKVDKDIKTFFLLSNRLLDIDLAIAGSFRDFYLQQQTLSPISQTLIRLTGEAEDSAEEQIEHARTLAHTIIPASTFFGILILLYISRLIQKSITLKVLRLADAAEAFRDGKLNTRIKENGQDELGKLASTFNTMAERLNDLIYNLETKVSQRTTELAASEEQFRHLVRELPNIAVQGYDTERNITYWNRASELLFGYSRDEAIGKKLEDLIIPESSHASFRSLIAAWCEDNRSIPASERILKHKNGSQVPVYTAYVMQINSSNVKTLYCVDVDLAELKRAQKKVRRSESFYQQLFRHSSSGVIVYEPIKNGDDFIIRDINSAGEVIEEVKRNIILGHKASEVFPDMKKTGLFELLREVHKTGSPTYRETTTYKDEQLHQSRDNRIYLLPSGEIVCVYDDITAQKQAMESNKLMEQSLQRSQKMEAIGLMAGGIAHDLNNTLSAIVGYPDLLLLQLSNDSPLRDPLQAIKTAGERAAAVVADLLTVAKGVATSRHDADLNQLVQEYLSSPEFNELQRQHPKIVFKNYLAADLPLSSCSPLHVKKCIMHLAANATEAIEQSGNITFSTRTQIPDQDLINRFGLQSILYAVIRITDDGSGISAKDLEHIFEPFYTKRTMGRIGGMGLGLSVVWNTMRDHGGAVVPASNTKITTFDLYFPASAKKDTSEKVVLPPPDNIYGSGETILIVDDEEQQRDLARKILEHYGYNVTCHESGENAVSYLQNHKVDLIVLDMIMSPGINGRQTYQEITRIHPKQKAIIASGFSESEDIQATLKMGAGLFLKKPYSIKELAVSVKKELERK